MSTLNLKKEQVVCFIRKGGNNCAAYLEKPELGRNSSNFVGLFNQYRFLII
jgi:hypothetical protein